jgi:very-short-patch-repair endonuclease
LDFYFPDIKLDLEIDGGQHERLERKQSDQRRDISLTANGYTVFRIKWFNSVNDQNRNLLKEQFDNFLDLYHKLSNTNK